MYFSKSLVAMGLAAALMIPAAPLFAGQAKAAVAVDDTTLHTRVDAAIKAQPTLKNQNIDVAVANGVVFIGGRGTYAGLNAFDAAGTTNCSGTPKVCQPLWSSHSGTASGYAIAVANGNVYVLIDNIAPAGLYVFHR